MDKATRYFQTLEDMLRACVIDFGGNWDVHLPSPVLWVEIGESSLIGPELFSRARTVKRFEWLEIKVLLKARALGKAYRLRLHMELSEVHDTFHVSNLKKCLADATLHGPLDEIKIDKTLYFVEEPL
ncbi:hypothetical protein Tco_1329512 [Tanacetum coccineum]